MDDPLSPGNADPILYGVGVIFQIGEGPTSEFAFSIPGPGEDLVWCSCPTFRMDDACDHMDQIMVMPPHMRGR